MQEKEISLVLPIGQGSPRGERVLPDWQDLQEAGEDRQGSAILLDSFGLEAFDYGRWHDQICHRKAPHFC